MTSAGGGAERAKELLAQGGSAGDVELAAERRDDVAALRPGGNTQATNAAGARVHHRPPIRWAGQAAWCASSPGASAAAGGPWNATGAFRGHDRHPPSSMAPPRPSPGPALSRGEGGPGGHRGRNTSRAGMRDTCAPALSCAIMWVASLPSAHERGSGSCLAGPRCRSRPGLGAAEGSAHDRAQLCDPGSSRGGGQPGADSADPGRPWPARRRWRGGLGRQARGRAIGVCVRTRPGAGWARLSRRRFGHDLFPFHG